MIDNKDMTKLQYVSALKFLGFSNAEAKILVKADPKKFKEVISLKKQTMKIKKEQIEAVIKAIEETEKLIKNNGYDYRTIVETIQKVQTDSKPVWMNKYLKSEL